MSVSVARSTSGGSSSSPTTLQLYTENAASPIAPVTLAINSIALGSGATTNAINSLAIGDQSYTRIQGSVVQANGKFATAGDAQVGRYVLRSVTTTATETELFVDGTGGSLRLVLPNNSTWTFRITITGHRTDASDGHAGFSLSGVVYRAVGVGTIALQGVVTKDIYGRSNTPWDVRAYVDVVNGSLNVAVTGEVGKTIRWVAFVETVEVTN